MVDSVTSVKLHVTISGDMKFHMLRSQCLLVVDGPTPETIGNSCKKILLTDLESDGRLLSFLTSERKTCIMIEKKIIFISLVESES